MSREVLVYAVGEEGLEALSQAFGGSDYRVPSGPGTDAFDRLVGILGEEDACALIAVAGGDVLYIPRCHADSLSARNEAILRMLRQGMTPGQVARKFTYTVGVSERHVYRIMERSGFVREAQQDLFNADGGQDSGEVEST